MKFLSIIKEIKEVGFIKKYILIDFRILQNSEIYRIYFKKINKNNIIYKKIDIKTINFYDDSEFEKQKINKINKSEELKFEDAYNFIENFCKDFVVIGNSIRIFDKFFKKNCKWNKLKYLNLKFLDAFFVSRLAYQKSHAISIGQFANELKIFYSIENILEDFNICNLLDEVFKKSIKEIIKHNLKMKIFMDYEKNLKDAKLQIVSKMLIILMLLFLFLFLMFKL